MIKINKASTFPQTILASEAWKAPDLEDCPGPFKTRHKIYKDVLLDSGAEITITNDIKLFIEDSLEYLGDEFDFNIVSLNGENTSISAIGVLGLNVYADDDSTIEIYVLGAYIDNECIGTIVSESDLIQTAGCSLHKIGGEEGYFIEAGYGDATYKIMLPYDDKLTFLQLIRPVEESEFALPAICPTIYKWYHLLKEQRAISDANPSGPGTPGEIPPGPSVSIDTALNGDPNHAATAVKQYSWRINSSSVMKYWSKISGLTLTSLRDGNIPKPKMPRPSINNSKLTINSPISTGIMNDLPSDDIIQSNNKYQLVENAPLYDCKRVYGYDIMCRNSVLQNQMAYFTCGIMNTEPLNWSISNYQSVDNVQHQAQYLHDVSGHMSAEHLISAIETGCIQGVELTSKLKDAINMYRCEYCDRAFHHRIRHHGKKPRIAAKRPYQVLHMDVVHYPSQLKIKLDLDVNAPRLEYVRYWLEAEYMLVVRDEYSGRGFVKPMKDASCINQAFDFIMDDIVLDRAARLSSNLQNLPENDCTVEYVWSDASTLISSTLANFAHDNRKLLGKNKNIWINFDYPEADEHDRNGLVERYIGLCKYIARTVMFQSNMYLYALAFHYASMILNFSVHQTVEGFKKSPYHIMFNRSVPFKYLVPFGIYGYIQAKDTDRKTRGDTNYMGYVVGFSQFHRPQEKMLLRIKSIDQPLPGYNAHGFPELQIKQSDQIRYDCWETVREDLTKRQIREEYFNRFKKNIENEDDFWKHDMVLQRDGSVKPVLSQDRWRKWFSQLTLQKTVEGRKKIYIDFMNDWNANCKPEQKVSIPKAGSEAKYKEIVDTIIQMDGYSNFSQTKVVPTSVKSFGPEYRPLYSSDLDIYLSGTYDIDVDDLETTKLTEDFPLFQCHTDMLSSEYVRFDKSGINEVRVGQKSTDDFVPRRRIEDYSQEEIRDSLLKEHNNLISTGTIEEVPIEEWNTIPKSKQITSHTFTEVKPDNTLKSRTVAHGNKQTLETFTMKSYGQIQHNTINLLLIKGLNMNLLPYQIDIGHAFLDEEVDEEIYIWIDKKLYKLRKALYGLRQAGLLFYNKISRLLIQFGYTKSVTDSSLFFRYHDNGSISMVGLLTDDLLLVMPNYIREELVKNLSDAGLNIKSHMEVVRYNGLEIKYVKDDNGDLIELRINQIVQLKQLIADLSEKLNIGIPARAKLPKADFNKDDNSESIDNTLYRSVIGSLLWINRMTRPEISYLVSKAASVSSSPKLNHLNILLDLIGYLKHTVDREVVHKRNPSGRLDFTVFSDSSWGDNHPIDSDIIDQKSITGFVLMINSTALSWRSVKQSTVSRSATEAEFKAAFDAANEVFYVLKLLNDINEPQSHILHFIDNEACVDNITARFVMKQTKYLEIKYAWLRDVWEKGMVWPVKIPTTMNISDFLTKPAEDIKGGISHVDRQYAIVNGTFYNTYSEFNSWISDLCSSSKFTKTKDVKDYQDLIRLKEGSKSKVDAILDMHKTMSYYERIRLALMKKSTFTL